MARLARLVRTVVNLAEKVLDDPQPAPVNLGDGGYADRIYIGLLQLREAATDTYDVVVDRVATPPRLLAALDLDDELAGAPAPSTVCEAANRLSAAFWRTMLAITTTLFSLNGVCAIDASAFGRSAASRRYEKRSGYTIRSLKTTLLVNVESLAILDVHCTTGKPHDTQIGWQVLKRNLHHVETLTADKGYDWDEFRHKLREAGVRPVIKHREFSSLDAAHNARIDDDTYHRRSVVESVFAALRRRFDDTIRARTWFGQFREIVLKAAVKNIEATITLCNP